MDIEKMEMLIEAYEGFMDLEKLINAVTGENILHTYDDGVFGKLYNIYKVIKASSVYKTHSEKDEDMFYEIMMSRNMKPEIKARILLGMN